MAKLEREALATFLDTNWNKTLPASSSSTQPAWEIIGDDIEEMSVELNSDVETTKNILGQTKTKDNGYEPSVEANPFYADPDSGIYEKLRDIALERKKGDACKTLMLEVIVEDTSDTSHLAFVSEVMCKPTSYGGDTSGLNFPFTVTEDGKRTKGTVTHASVVAGAPVFTPAT